MPPDYAIEFAMRVLSEAFSGDDEQAKAAWEFFDRTYSEKLTPDEREGIDAMIGKISNEWICF